MGRGKWGKEERRGDRQKKRRGMTQSAVMWAIVALSMQLCVFVSPWHSWHMGNVQTVLTRAIACVLFLWRTSYGVFRAS